MELHFTDILPYLASIITGVAGWMTGRKKQKNDFLTNLQASIDLLAEKNRQLTEEVVKLRGENMQLRDEIEALCRQYKKALKELKEKTNEKENRLA
jgi:FtsZ-binding cell division protein ZapB